METTHFYNRVFVDALKGKSHYNIPDLEEGYRKGTDAYNIPHGFKGDYSTVLKEENIFRRYATEMYVKDTDESIMSVLATAEAEICEDGVAYPEDSDEFIQIPFKAYKIASLCKVSDSFVYDKKFDIQKYITNEFARRFGRAEEHYFINGTGVGQPTGILDAADIGVETAELTYDDVVKLFFSVKPEYRKNAVWVMNDDTALKLRTLKNSAGDYIWNHSNNTILGKPVEISNHMPNAENGNKPIFFGDLSYFWILQRDVLYVRTLVEKYAPQGAVGYVGTERLDGKLVRSEAVKTLKITA